MLLTGNTDFDQALNENEMDVVTTVDVLDTLAADDLDEPSIPSDLMRTLNGQSIYHPRAADYFKDAAGRRF